MNNAPIFIVQAKFQDGKNKIFGMWNSSERAYYFAKECAIEFQKKLIEDKLCSISPVIKESKNSIQICGIAIWTVEKMKHVN